MLKERQLLESVIVNAQQMRLIEKRIFDAGMPVPALMEKAASLSSDRIQTLYPLSHYPKVGILMGPGHNGGDVLVIARELHLNGYQVSVYCPIANLKPLTTQHANYAQSLGIPFHKTVEPLQSCDVLIDGLFGFGLTRSLSGDVAQSVDFVNQWQKPIVSLDLPSGLHTDTGEVLGIAIKATHSLCLGLWKFAYFQDQAAIYIGDAERIDFGIPPFDVWAILSQPPPIQQMTPTLAQGFLPLPRPLTTYKYQQGHLLLICGSSRYAGGSILTGLGARASGVGMLSLAVPESLKPILVQHLPDALIIGCPETENGAIAQLPPIASDFSQYNVIACGPGLTPKAQSIVQQVLEADCPLIVDADGLNILAQQETNVNLSKRKSETILTPHLGEFKRLFPNISFNQGDRLTAVQQAAQESNTIVLLKGAKTAIAHPNGSLWLIGESTPALARGGSGDVLTGLIGGLVAQNNENIPLEALVATAAWWHAQAGILAAQNRTELGVDPVTLSSYLSQAIAHNFQNLTH